MAVVNHICDIDHVKFISYTGKYPNLCSGVLTLEIDGEEIRFGHDYTKHDSWKTDGNFDSFWVSGGGCSYDEITRREWLIDMQELPHQFRKYVYEIDSCFNDHVPYGCCGGCR